MTGKQSTAAFEQLQSYKLDDSAQNDIERWLLGNDTFEKVDQKFKKNDSSFKKAKRKFFDLLFRALQENGEVNSQLDSQHEELVSGALQDISTKIYANIQRALHQSEALVIDAILQRMESVCDWEQMEKLLKNLHDLNFSNEAEKLEFTSLIARRYYDTISYYGISDIVISE